MLGIFEINPVVLILFVFIAIALIYGRQEYRKEKKKAGGNRVKEINSFYPASLIAKKKPKQKAKNVLKRQISF